MELQVGSCPLAIVHPPLTLSLRFWLIVSFSFSLSLSTPSQLSMPIQSRSWMQPPRRFICATTFLRLPFKSRTIPPKWRVVCSAMCPKSDHRVDKEEVLDQFQSIFYDIYSIFCVTETNIHIYNVMSKQILDGHKSATKFYIKIWFDFLLSLPACLSAYHTGMSPCVGLMKLFNIICFT